MDEIEERRFSVLFRRIVVFLFAICFGLVGFIQVIWAVAVCWKSIDAENLPTVPATIIKSAVRVDTARGGFAYTPTVTYQYRFAGQSYEGRRITAMDSAETEQSVRLIVNSLPPGRTVAAYVDPSDPSYALLRPGFFPYLPVWAALALLALLIGIAGMIWAVRSKNADFRSIPKTLRQNTRAG